MWFHFIRRQVTARQGAIPTENQRLHSVGRNMERRQHNALFVYSACDSLSLTSACFDIPRLIKRFDGRRRLGTIKKEMAFRAMSGFHVVRGACRRNQPGKLGDIATAINRILQRLPPQ
jgi:hypothetical protein